MALHTHCLVLGLAVAACTAKSQTPEPGPAPAAMPIPATAKVPVREAVPVAIGVTERPRVEGKARKANRKGLKLHERGEWTLAHEQFAKAVDQSGAHDMARFNRACAASRTGQLEDAAADVLTVLEHDPARFVSRVRDDEDLGTLRKSASWPAIEARLAAVELALDEAFAIGVPAMFFDYKPAEIVYSEEVGGTRNLVAGLYLHEAGRFVPLSHGGTMAMVDVARKRVMTLRSHVWEGISHSVFRSTQVTVRSAEIGRDWKVTAGLESDGPAAVGRPNYFDVADNHGFTEHVVIAPTDEGAWLDLAWLDLEGYTGRRSKLALTPAGLASTKSSAPATGPRIALVLEGAVIFDPPPPGHALAGRKYQPPGTAGPVALSAGHKRARWQSVTLSPDGRYAVVTSIEHREGPGYGLGKPGVLRHAIDRVDLEIGTAINIVQGKGSARTIIGPGGALYVEAGGKVRRWASVATAPADPRAVMPGLRLGPALEPMICDLCG